LVQNTQTDGSLFQVPRQPLVLVDHTRETKHDASLLANHTFSRHIEFNLIVKQLKNLLVVRGLVNFNFTVKIARKLGLSDFFYGRHILAVVADHNIVPAAEGRIGVLEVSYERS
jgi:hypothetical protein